MGNALHILTFDKKREILDLLDVVPKENVLTTEKITLAHPKNY